MARRRKLSEGKKNIIAGLIEEYNIQTANDIQEALKDLLGGTIQEMLEAELDEHLGYQSYERSDNTDYRNGSKPKPLKAHMVKSLLMSLKIEMVILNLKLFKSVKRIFQR